MCLLTMAGEGLNTQENPNEKVAENPNEKAISITSDGACIFRSISYLIFGTEAMFLDVRQAILLHIIKNWKYFSQIIYESQGNKYKSIAEYFADMSKPFTQGGLPEIQAAVQIYNVVFEVYTGDKLYFKVGQEGRPVVTLRYAELPEDDSSSAYLMESPIFPFHGISVENLTQESNEISNTMNHNIAISAGSCDNMEKKLQDFAWRAQAVYGFRTKLTFTSNKYCFIQEKPRKRYRPMTLRAQRLKSKQGFRAKAKILAYEATLRKEQENLRLRCRKEIEENSNPQPVVKIKEEVEDVNADAIEIEEPNLIQIKQEPVD